MSPLSRAALRAVPFALLLVGCPSSSPPEETEVSTGHLELYGVSVGTFNALSSTVAFRVVDARMAPDGDRPIVLVNGAMLPDGAVLVTPDALTLTGLSLEERNDVDILAWDTDGLELTAKVTVWAGDQTLDVTVLDENRAPLSGATVRASLGDDRTVFAEATSAGGHAKFVNLPRRTIALDAQADGNRFAGLPTYGAAGSETLRFVGWSPASAVDNNDFQQGTAGWTTSNPAAVKVVPHEETTTGYFTEAIRDMDLMLRTVGIGQETVSRTFKIGAATKAATLRYRFITSEVPGGYFGSRYNDYFMVTVRSKKTGQILQQEDSMNALGLSVFDASGATSWRELSLPVLPDDTVQVDISVANVADGLYDSAVVVDMVQEKQLAITGLTLLDVDDSKLGYLSGAPHDYLLGQTELHGTITIVGAKYDLLERVNLEVLQRGQPVAYGDLSGGAASDLYKTFGDSEKLEIAKPGSLFGVSSVQLAQIDGREDGPVSLRVTAYTDKEAAQRDFDAVQLLVRYTGANRYGPRDGSQGGDDWVRPSTKAALDAITALNVSGFVVGDTSNMNGGFFRLHAMHQDGIDADLWFDGYNARDGKAAKTLLRILDDPTTGPKILFVVVTFTPKTGNAFFDAIDGYTLADGRLATDVIRAETKGQKHTTHFHVRFKQ